MPHREQYRLAGPCGFVGCQSWSQILSGEVRDFAAVAMVPEARGFTALRNRTLARVNALPERFRRP